MRDTIAGLKQQQAEELAAIAKGGTGSRAMKSERQSGSPEYAASIESDGCGNRGTARRHRTTRVGNQSAATFVNTAPDVEQRFATLNRDYDVTKAQYAALVEHMEKARISEDADRPAWSVFE